MSSFFRFNSYIDSLIIIFVLPLAIMKKTNSIISAITIPLVYLVLSILYISFSDKLILSLSDDPVVVTRYQTLKGWLYVLLVAVLLFVAIYRRLKKRNLIIDELRQKEQINIQLTENYQRINEEMKLASEKYFRIISKLSQPMLLLEAVYEKNKLVDLRFIEINQAAEAVVRLNRISTEIKTLTEIVDTTIAALIFDTCNEVLKTGEARKIEFVSKFMNKFVELHIFRFNENQLVFLYFDISNLKETENKLIKAKQKAEESDRLKTAFLQNMSHEIRTPMNGIVGFSDLLCQTDISDEIRDKYVQVIQSSGHQLMRIIDDILDLSRIESGVEEIHNSVFSLNELIDNMVLVLRESIRKKNKPIVVQVIKPLAHPDDIIESDEHKIRQILWNLVSNAEKFTYSGSIVLAYSIADNNMVEILVKDSGIGISGHDQQIIFERFRQAEENLSRKYGGSGLGLSICKGLVELLGGSIVVDSEPGQGSVFRFYIPYVKAITVRENVSEELLPPEPHAGKVLIVDDLYENILLLSEFMRDTGIEVLSAENGAEAHEQLQKNPDVKLVLMDIKLSGEDGISIAKELMLSYPELVVVAQTAYSSEQIKEECLDAGFSSYIVKPIDKQGFLDIVVPYLQA